MYCRSFTCTYVQLAVLEIEVSELRQKLSELEVRERAMKEEHQLESLQQELSSIREKLHDQEVRKIYRSYTTKR